MKTDIHPESREVLFHDVGVDKYFLIRSTVSTTQTKEWEDGNTYPVSYTHLTLPTNREV